MEKTKIPSELSMEFTSVEGRRKLMELYGDSKSAFSGNNELGEKVLVSISHTGIILRTFQENGWVRVTYYGRAGHPEGEGFDGKWQ